MEPTPRDERVKMLVQLSNKALADRLEELGFVIDSMRVGKDMTRDEAMEQILLYEQEIGLVSR